MSCMIRSADIRRPAAKSQVSGFQQPTHRSGQPWSHSTNRVPGPLAALRSVAARMDQLIASGYGAEDAGVLAIDAVRQS